ncbi:MAG: endolytic transglycosylase MltG [Patescibacteria group bacterium]
MNFNYKLFLIIFIGFFQLFILESSLYLYADYKINKPLDISSKNFIIFEIGSGDSSTKISKRLYSQGLISSEFIFNYYIKKSKKENSLKAGKYLLSHNMSIRYIADKIIFGDIFIDKVKLVIPEGFTTYDISDKLSKLEISGKKDFLEYKVGDFKEDFYFLSDIDDGESLEGFLFPDTYEYNKATVTTEIVIKSMLDNFGKKFRNNLYKEMARQDKSIFSIITMASIIEKEVRTNEDLKIVSGILWKRLSVNMPLQVDATIVYASGHNEITRDDLNFDSPYNTYLNNGLPKGPISNPGISAIEAAIYPSDSEYWFYISKPTGISVFSKNFDEHREAIKKYLK